MVNLTINGQPVAVPEGTFLLEAVRARGVDLPTLCSHKGLSPSGTCRLCMVAITEPFEAVVASCVYPVKEGLVVETEDPKAVAARRKTLEFLLSRCPSSSVIQQMAAKHGVTSSRFGAPPLERADELCMLCGLCVRVCRDVIGASAISFVGHGMERKVSTAFDFHSDACIGCGACAAICPTGAIKIEDRGNKRILHTWNTTVELHACPECGHFHTPKPMSFLKEMFPEIKGLWGLCPQCRQQKTARQWLKAQFIPVQDKGQTRI